MAPCAAHKKLILYPPFRENRVLKKVDKMITNHHKLKIWASHFGGNFVFRVSCFVFRISYFVFRISCFRASHRSDLGEEGQGLFSQPEARSKHVDSPIHPPSHIFHPFLCPPFFSTIQVIF
eukprot:scaffold4731_cov175-Ochromonas_danica.AAC.9